MSKPYIHANNSVKKWGGKVADYLPIHEFMDLSKAVLGENRHRALTHHAWFIATVLDRVFGAAITNSDGIEVPVRDIGEQHVLDDFGGKFIPTAEDYLVYMAPQEWMSSDGSYPPSARGIPAPHGPEKVVANQKAPVTPTDESGPLRIDGNTKRATLWGHPASLFDTEYVSGVREITFFQRPISQEFRHRGDTGDKCDRRKSFKDTNLNQSSMLDYPREFDVQGIAVFFLRYPKWSHGLVTLTIGIDKVPLHEQSFALRDFPSVVNGDVALRKMMKSSGNRTWNDNPLLVGAQALPVQAAVPLNLKIKPGVPFSVAVHFNDPLPPVGCRMMVALTGTMYEPDLRDDQVEAPAQQSSAEEIKEAVKKAMDDAGKRREYQRHIDERGPVRID